MVWVVLAAWLVASPLMFTGAGTAWWVHALAVGLLALVSLPALWRSRRVRVGLPGLAVGLALLSLLIALLAAPAGLPRAEMRWAALMGALHALFFLLCLAHVPAADAPAAKVRRATRWLVLLLVAMVVGQLAVVIASWQPITSETRPEGTLGNPNVLGGLIAAVALLLAGVARFRVRALLLVVPLAACVLSTGSRGAVAAGGLTLLLFAVRRRKRGIVAALLVAALVAVTVPNPLRDRVLMLRAEHSFSRPFIWDRAMQSIVEHPLGIGPRMNKYVFPTQAHDPARPWLLHQRRAVAITHNVYLTLFLEWGWLAGLSVVGLTGWVVVRFGRRRRRPDDPLGTGAALGASVLFFEMQVDGIEQHRVVFSVFLLLVAITVARTVTRGTTDQVVGGTSSRIGFALPGRVLAVGLMLLLLPLGWVVAGRWEAGRLRGRAQEAVASALSTDLDTTRMLAAREAIAAAQAVRFAEIATYREEFAFSLSVIQRLVGDEPGEVRDALLAEALASAREALDRSFAANQADVALQDRAARFELYCHRRRIGEPGARDRAHRWWERLLVCDPLDVAARWDLALDARGAGKTDLWEVHFTEVVRLEPDHAVAWFGAGRLAEAAGDGATALHHYVRAQEALRNSRLLAGLGDELTRGFYARNVRDVDLPDLLERIAELRRNLYF
jgi:O-antigen ligase